MSSTISAAQVRELRDMSGAPMMDCKKALTESDGDLEKAGEWLRKKGIAKAAKKADREAGEGLVSSYIHHNGRVGVLLDQTLTLADHAAQRELLPRRRTTLCCFVELGLQPRADGLEATSVAALTEVGRVLFNLDETVTRQ